MKIDCLILGTYQTNCYVLRESDTAKDCLIIDAGMGSKELINFLHKHNLNPAAVILTHGHIDHIASVMELRKHYQNIKVYIHNLDAAMLAEPQHNLSALLGSFYEIDPADLLLQDGSIIEQAGINLQVLHTPGHTPGGICLYSKNDGIVFTDDVLFEGSVSQRISPEVVWKRCWRA